MQRKREKRRNAIRGSKCHETRNNQTTVGAVTTHESKHNGNRRRGVAVAGKHRIKHGRGGDRGREGGTSEMKKREPWIPLDRPDASIVDAANRQINPVSNYCHATYNLQRDAACSRGLCLSDFVNLSTISPPHPSHYSRVKAAMTFLFCFCRLPSLQRNTFECYQTCCFRKTCRRACRRA